MQGPASQPALVFITIFWSQCLHSLPMSTLSLRPVRHQISGFDLRNFFIFWSLCVHLSLSWSSLSLSLAWTATWSFCPAVLLSSHQLALASCCFWNQTQALHPRVQSFVIVWSPISPHPKPINSTLVPGTIRHHFLLPKMTFNVPYHLARDFPGGTRGKEPACQCRRHRRRSFNPWFRKIPWKRAWKPTQVFLLGKSHGQRSLVGYSPWGHKRVKHNWATKHVHMHSEPVKSLSHVWLFASPWTVAHQAPPPMGISRQEYWRGVPLPSPGDLPDPGTEPSSRSLQADALPYEPPGTFPHYLPINPVCLIIGKLLVILQKQFKYHFLSAFVKVWTHLSPLIISVSLQSTSPHITSSASSTV